MKRQRDLFGFFQPVEKVLQREDAAVASENCSTPTESKVSRRISKSSRTPDTHSRANVVLLPAERSLTQEDNEACFLIPGTPDHTQSSASQAARSPLSPLVLTSRPTFQQSQSTYSPVERPRRRAVAKRRSSFTVRRQAELDEKCSVVLNSPPALTGEPQAVRDYRQVKTAAFVRRGNYDQLNYAPSDQIPIHPDDRSSTNSEIRLGNFKPRSTLLVSKALCQGNSHRGFLGNCIRTGSRKQPLLNSDSFTECIRVSEDENEVVRNDENLAHFSDNPPSRTGLTVIIGALRQNLAYNKPSIEVHTPPDNQSDVLVAGHGVFPDASLSLNPNTQLLISEPRGAPSGGIRCTPERRSDYSLPDGPYFRATIRSVSRHRNGVSASALAFPVGTVERHSIDEIELHLDLRDSWVETDLQVGDTVNILSGAEFSSIGKHITIDDSEASDSAPGTHIPAAVIHHPDTLIPGTKITGSYYCLRRSILESFWPAGDDGLDDNLLEDRQATTNYKTLMLIGSIVHELFQRLIVSTEPTVQQGRELLEVILRQPETMLQLYAYKLSSEELRTRVLSQLEKLVSWITRHLERTYDRRSHTAPMHPIIHVVTEIEENIWSSRLGIKGRIDLSALCLLPPTEAGNRMISKLNTSAIDSLVLLPLELKTGRPTYSIEHKGQVLLYMMLLRDRYGPEYSHPNGQVARTADAGWLVYPQDDRELRHAAKPDPGLVAPLLPSFRGLLQARNRIAYHLHRLLQSVSETSQSSDYSCWTPRLPDVISQLRTCHMCPLQLPCSLFAADSRQFEANHIKLHTKYADACNSVTELLQPRKSHLSTTHLAFFSFWCRLVLLEHISCDRLEDLVARIVSHSSPGVGSLKNSGSIRRLKFLGSSCVSVSFQDQWHTTLVPSDPNAISRSNDYGLEPGDLVVISSDDGCHIGLALGTIISLPRFNSAPCPHDDHSESQQDPFVLSSDRPLPTWVHRFRLDRYSSPKVTQLNLSNLVGLMQRSPLCDRLRSLIVDGVRPTYKNTLSKSLVAGIRRILKHLNSSQRTAILRVLMADHYVLIKGYPGTGKTETLVSLLRVFSHMRKKVLVVAHTHSAVDTLLFRLVNSGEKNVLRLGPPDRVHNQLLGYCLEEMLNHKSASIDPDDFIQNALDQAAVVGCTALAASGGANLRHAALSRTCFDLVLIDEASQLLLPTALGAILCLRALSDSGLQESQADASRFVLVGDPHQLPPLVRSSQARHGGLDRSLFHHLLDICSPSSGASSHNKTASRSASVTHTVELNLQYRMNSPIMRLANMLSYSNAIQSINSIVADSTLADVLRPPSDHAYSHNDEALPCWLRRALSPSLSDSVVLLDTKQLQICQSQYSENRKYSNKLEAQLAALLCILLVQQGLPPSDTGIITPYRNQVALVKRLLTECSEPLVTQVEVATVDQFQGRDKRAIILCLTACTKSPPSSTPDHLLEDSARLTVALTRAKHKLLIIGCCHEEFSEDDTVCLASSSVLARLFKLVHQAHGHETLQPPDLLFLKHYGYFNFIPQEPS